MKTAFSKHYILSHKGCYSKKQIIRLLFPYLIRVITLKDIIESKIPYKDKIWFIWNNCNFNYDDRLKCYEQSQSLQKLFSPGWSFLGSYHCASTAAGGVGLIEQTIVLNEILKYSKIK